MYGVILLFTKGIIVTLNSDCEGASFCCCCIDFVISQKWITWIELVDQFVFESWKSLLNLTDWLEQKWRISKSKTAKILSPIDDTCYMRSRTVVNVGITQIKMYVSMNVSTKIGWVSNLICKNVTFQLYIIKPVHVWTKEILLRIQQKLLYKITIVCTVLHFIFGFSILFDCTWNVSSHI